MTFLVRQTDQAHRDLADIFQWLLDQYAGGTGLRWFDRLQEAMETLSDTPQRCALAAESEEFGFEVRQLMHGRRPHLYRVLFTIEDDTVVILHIRHGKRRRLTR